jgi:hypothetical protein
MEGTGVNEGEASSPIPSARCGMGGASPSFNLPNTLFSVPPGYDGVTPLPVVMAFHAAGNPNTQLRGILGATLQNDYIVFYPKSDGNGWTNGADAPKIDAIFAALDANACYDKHRVFATGHSSGAQFVVQRLCAGESRCGHGRLLGLLLLVAADSRARDPRHRRHGAAGVWAQ